MSTWCTALATTQMIPFPFARGINRATTTRRVSTRRSRLLSADDYFDAVHSSALATMLPAVGVKAWF